MARRPGRADRRGCQRTGRKQDAAETAVGPICIGNVCKRVGGGGLRSRARDNLDKLVCSSSRLSVAEEQMASSFHAARRRGVDMQMLQSTHIEWYEQVRNACNDVACLLRAFDERSAELDNY